MNLAKTKSIDNVWEEFNAAFPFLSIDFFTYQRKGSGSLVKHKLNKSTNLDSAGIHREGDIEILETMTVKQVEQNFRNQFGLEVEISRKSGNVWLQTTISDDWTLKRQNDHGRELSEPAKSPTPPREYN